MTWLKDVLAKWVSPDPVVEQRRLHALVERRLAESLEHQATPESPPVSQTRNDVS
jgi:hypothetical protein